MVILRSGRQTVHEDYNLDYCRHFLAGEYTNLSLYTLVQIRQLKLSLESNFDTIHHEIANDRHHIELFLLAQWRQYHEDLVLISTPDNRILFKFHAKSIGLNQARGGHTRASQ